MDLGLALPQAGHLADLDSLRTVAIAAENAGYASLWALDRVLAPVEPRTPYPGTADGRLPIEQYVTLDPVVALATAAAVTDRIRIGTNVLIAPFYAPVLLARTAASLDRLSNGRFTLGLGLGWSADEYAAAGVEQSGLQLRIEEILEVLAIAWREDVVEIETTHELIAPSTIGLKPTARKVPLLLAAYTQRGLERVARRADGWTPAGVPCAALGSMWAGVLALAERYGRDPETLRLVVRANVKLTEEALGSDRPDFIGSIAQVRDDVERTRSLGAHELILDLHGAASGSDHLLDLAGELTEPVPVLR